MGALPRTHRWAGWSAIATFAIFSIANALWAFEQPDPGAAGPELLEFYADLSQRIEIGAPLSLLSIATLGIFASALRPVLIELDGDQLFANVAFAGAVVGMAAGIGAESINMAAALRAGDETLTEPVATALFDVSYMFGSYAAGVGFGLLTAAIGAVSIRTRALLPRWLALLAVAVGLGELTPFWHMAFGQYGLGPSFLIIFALGVLLLRGGGLPRPRPA